MNSGNDSNCVHWLYATLTGTSTTMSFSIFAMSLSLKRCCSSGVVDRVLARVVVDDLREWAVPGLQEVVRVEDVVLRKGRRLLFLALDDRNARLAAYGARELHHERLRLGGDAAHGAARKSRAAGRALHRADALQDRSDPVHGTLGLQLRRHRVMRSVVRRPSTPAPAVSR